MRYPHKEEKQLKEITGSVDVKAAPSERHEFAIVRLEMSLSFGLQQCELDEWIEIKWRLINDD